MTQILISGNIIPALTGGVFGYEQSLTVSDSLTTTPAFILASYIIEQTIGAMTDPDDALDWPLYVSRMPDGDNIKTNCGTLYDSSGVKDGRLMNGPVIVHQGIQLRIRCNDHVTGWAKAEAIAVALDAVARNTVVISSTTYRIDNVSRTSSVISLGAEEGTKGRLLFTVNFLVTIKRITS